MLASKLGLATLLVTNELPHQVFSGRRCVAKVLSEIVSVLPRHIQLQPPHPPAPSPPEEKRKKVRAAFAKRSGLPLANGWMTRSPSFRACEGTSSAGMVDVHHPGCVRLLQTFRKVLSLPVLRLGVEDLPPDFRADLAADGLGFPLVESPIPRILEQAHKEP